MRRQKRIHERFEIRPPPLRQRVANLPLIVHTLARELRADRCEALVEAAFEALDFVVGGVQVVAWSGSRV